MATINSVILPDHFMPGGNMTYRHIALETLSVNRANDRHGELENETAAIAWLFNNREQHMKNLAKDIIEKGEIYEPPLVWQADQKYIVFDGNRRVTCLKLLQNPRKAPTVELRDFFEGLKNNFKGDLPDSLQCQLETDRDRIDDILYRRHTGTQDGVGQSTWDDRMKSNFISRTGKGVSFSVAEEIENHLREADLLPTGKKKIPRSTLNRLMSAEAFRNRVGFSVVKGKIEFTHHKDVVLKALHRITDDLAHKEVVLGDVWDVDGKRAYLDELDAEGLLPTVAHTLSTPKVAASVKLALPAKPAVPKPVRRTTLIPNATYPIAWAGRIQRQRMIWEELQHRLQLSEHPNAIAVLFRVLLELSVDNYIAQVNPSTLTVKDASLARRVLRVAEDLYAKKKIDNKYLGVFQKFQSLDPLVSADTLNRYVHSSNFAPSPDHLTALWDSVAEFLVHCLSV